MFLNKSAPVPCRFNQRVVVIKEKSEKVAKLLAQRNACLQILRPGLKNLSNTLQPNFSRNS